jgi:hypothetical protein
MMGRRARRYWLALDQVDRSAERRAAFLAEVEAHGAKLR